MHWQEGGRTADDIVTGKRDARTGKIETRRLKSAEICMPLGWSEVSKKDRHRYARIWIRSGDRCQLKRGRNVDTKGGRYESERGVCVRRGPG
jgi:hypothetical protein